jgi:hypothetical protein
VIQIAAEPQRIKGWQAQRKSVLGLLYIRADLGYAAPW